MNLPEYILANYPPYRKWERFIFDSWLHWHLQQGFVLTALNDDDSIAGVVIIRPVMKADDAHDFYAFDPEGSVLFIDLAIATTANALKALGFATLKRWGMRDFVAWQKAPYYVIEQHSAARLRRHLLRREKLYGQFR